MKAISLKGLPGKKKSGKYRRFKHRAFGAIETAARGGKEVEPVRDGGTRNISWKQNPRGDRGPEFT